MRQAQAHSYTHTHTQFCVHTGKKIIINERFPLKNDNFVCAFVAYERHMNMKYVISFLIFIFHTGASSARRFLSLSLSTLRHLRLLIIIIYVRIICRFSHMRAIFPKWKWSCDAEFFCWRNEQMLSMSTAKTKTMTTTTTIGNGNGNGNENTNKSLIVENW